MFTLSITQKFGLSIGGFGMPFASRQKALGQAARLALCGAEAPHPKPPFLNKKNQPKLAES